MPCFCKNKVIAKGKVFKESILNVKEKKKKKMTATRIFIIKRKF